jgi:biofilm PGA synthesis N-glycosyltransferase PgaC
VEARGRGRAKRVDEISSGAAGKRTLESALTAWLFWFFIAYIVYVYAAYPLALALMASLKRAPSFESAVDPPGDGLEPTPAPPSVTLLIAAYNEEEVLERKIANSLELDYPRDRLQILVAADGSSDRTTEIVRTFAGKGVLLSYDPERRGKMAAINRAMPMATGEIVVFSDANNLYERDALRELTAPFADGSVGAVTGAKVIVEGDGALGGSEGLYWRYESFIKSMETRLSTCTGVSGEILAVRRELFKPAPEGVINDDFYIGMRVVRQGRRVVYAPQALSYERVSASAQDEVARRARIVAGRFQALTMARELLPGRPLVAWQVISHKFARPLVPLAMIGALVTNVTAAVRPSEAGWPDALRLAAPYGWIALACQVIFYAAALLPRAGVRPAGIAGRLLYLPSFLVDSNVAALVGMIRFATGRQSAQWQRVRRA